MLLLACPTASKAWAQQSPKTRARERNKEFVSNYALPTRIEWTVFVDNGTQKNHTHAP